MSTLRKAMEAILNHPPGSAHRIARQALDAQPVEPALDCDNPTYQRGYSDGQAYVIQTCSRFLKDGELPHERMERDHADSLALMGLLAKEKLKNEALAAAPQAAPADPPKLQLAATAVLRHWDEFGPEHGLDETMDGLRRVLRAIEAEVRSSQPATEPSLIGSSTIKPECSMSDCTCRICERGRRLRRCLAHGTKADLRGLVIELWEDLEHVEMDRDVNQAVIDGTWPTADEIIARARANAGAADQKARQGAQNESTQEQP